MKNDAVYSPQNVLFSNEKYAIMYLYYFKVMQMGAFPSAQKIKEVIL